MDSQKEIQNLKDMIQRLESKISADRMSTDEKVAKARASADNAHIVSRNSRLRYPYLYLALKKTVRFFFPLVLCLSTSYLDQKISGTGIDKAKKVSPNGIDVNAPDPNTVPSIGSLPQGFNGQLLEYTDMDIFKMIVFYNDDFKIERKDSLLVRIDKFRTYLSEFAEITKE